MLGENAPMSLFAPPAVERAMRMQEVILRAASGEITWLAAAQILGCTARTLRRWKYRYEKFGYDGLLDRRCRRPSPKRVPLSEVERVLHLYREKYDGLNVRHFHRKLRKVEGIEWSYTFVKTVLQNAGLVRKCRSRGRHRRRREPKPCFGEMLHIDGSRHAWLALEPEQKQTLIVVLDDATSRLLYAQLWPEETTEAILSALHAVLAEQGIPMSLYNDRAGWAFKTPPGEKKIAKSLFTQVGRALDRLGVEHIAAYSPQARGRSERVNRTLQDRLIQELRLAGIREVGAANEFIRGWYITEHNEQFMREPADPTNCFVSSRSVALNDILCIEEERTVGNDNIVRFDNRFLQLEKQHGRATCAGLDVLVREHLDGTLSIVRGLRLLGRYDPSGQPLRPNLKRKHRAA